MSQSKKQLAHLFDATQCIGCSACIVACAQTNYPEMVERENEGWNWLAANIRKVTLERAKRPVHMKNVVRSICWFSASSAKTRPASTPAPSARTTAIPKRVR